MQCQLLLKALQTVELLQCAIIVNRAGRLEISSKEWIKLFARVLYYKHKVNLKKAIDKTRQILASVRGDASGYADVTRCTIELYAAYMIRNPATRGCLRRRFHSS